MLRRLRNEDIIEWNYKPTETVAKIIKWTEIAREYGIKKKFSGVARKLTSKGYASDHGKSGDVLSITKMGIKLLEGLEDVHGQL